MRFLLRGGKSPFDHPEPPLPKLRGANNSGNLIFSQAVYKSLYKQANEISLGGYRACFASPEEINESYDAFVLPMANAFRSDYVERLNAYTDLIRRLKIPCVVVGVGAQAGLDLVQLNGSHVDNPVKEFVSAVLDRSATIGVRGQITGDYLNRLGFSAVDVIGCPSMFLNGPDVRVAKARENLCVDDFVAFNHTPGDRPEVEMFIDAALKRFTGATLICQDDHNVLRWASVTQNRSAKADDRLLYFNDVPQWIAFLRSRSFSVGTRIHGNIAAILAGTPAVVIAHDSRTLELAWFHKIPYILHNMVNSKTRLSDLYKMADFGPANAISARRFEGYVSFLEKNGLDHAWNDPANAAAFEERIPRNHFFSSST